MKRKLKEELVKLSTDIITSRGLNDIPELYEAARTLYEKLAVLKFIDEKLQDIEIDVSTNVIASRFESLANAVMNENKQVPESNPHKKDIIIPGIDTIKDMVSEMPSSAEAEQVFAEFVAKTPFKPQEKERSGPEQKARTGKENAPRSIHELLSKQQLQVGFNDRHAFVKHLFDNSAEDFNRVISQLNTIDTEERSLAFIQNMVKPDYNNWAGKEEFESRFMALISRRFS